MTTARLLAAIGILAVAAPLAAQQPNASPGAFGMSGNYTAAARNYDAVAWNPANLALPGNSVASFNLGALGGVAGLAPVDLPMIGRYDGTTIPVEAKEEWLRLIGEGRERGRAEGSASLLALSVKNVAFQIGASAYGDANLNRDAAEVLLYGNAGRTGTPGTFAFAGSTARGAAFTTGAASIGLPLPFTLTSSPDEMLSVGLTGKYVIGNAMVRAQDAGSTSTGGDVAVSFPSVYGSGADLGHGLGVDVGLAWHVRRVTLGVTVRNVVNSFAWDTTALRARLGTATVQGTTGASDFGDTTYATAPAAMRAAVADERFHPALAGGVALEVAESLLLTADASMYTGTGIEIGPQSQAGVGLRWSGIGALPIHLGASKISEGWQGAGGLGIRLGDNHIGLSALLRERDGGRTVGAMVNLIAFY